MVYSPIAVGGRNEGVEKDGVEILICRRSVGIWKWWGELGGRSPLGSRGIPFRILLASFLAPWGYVLDSLGKAYLHGPA